MSFHVKSVKEPFIGNDPEAMMGALELILDSRNYPILVHSNKGKHRVGTLVGVMRKLLQGWSLAAIFDEYGRFAGGKGDADVEVCDSWSFWLLAAKLTLVYRTIRAGTCL